MKNISKFLLVFIFLVQVAYADEVKEGLKALNRGDYKAAFEIWKPLAEKGNSTAQFNLGLMYDKGDGVRQNFPKAVRWYRLAAKQGNVSAQFNLGLMYYKGEGVARD